MGRKKAKEENFKLAPPTYLFIGRDDDYKITYIKYLSDFSIVTPAELIDASQHARFLCDPKLMCDELEGIKGVEDSINAIEVRSYVIDQMHIPNMTTSIVFSKIACVLHRPIQLPKLHECETTVFNTSNGLRICMPKVLANRYVTKDSMACLSLGQFTVSHAPNTKFKNPIRDVFMCSHDRLFKKAFDFDDFAVFAYRLNKKYVPRPYFSKGAPLSYSDVDIYHL
jgi:hypothetical protein